MPKHRNSEKLPKDLMEKIKASPYSEYFGNVYFVKGNGIRRFGMSRPIVNGFTPKPWQAMDIQYTLQNNIISRTEFLRGEPSIPVHIANYDSESGKKFATILDRFS